MAKENVVAEPMVVQPTVVDEEQSKQMNEMLEATGTPTVEPVVEKKSVEEAPAKVEEVKPAEVVEPAPVEKKKEEEKPGESVVEAEPAPVEKVELTPEETAEKLRKTVEEISKMSITGGFGTQTVDTVKAVEIASKVEPKVEEPQKEQQPSAPAKPAEPVEFVADDDSFNSMLTDRKEFNNFLNKTVETITKNAQEKAMTQVLTNIPSLVNKLISEERKVTGMVNEFYQAYPHLQPFKDFVGIQANAIASQKPGIAIPELLKEAAKAVEEKLSLSGVAKTIEEGRVATPAPVGAAATPAFAGASSSRRTPVVPTKPEDKTSQKGQIDTMLNTLKM